MAPGIRRTGAIPFRWWIAALLFASTTIITGPLTKHVDGIDLSFISAAIIGGVLYFVLVKIFPEHGVAPITPSHARIPARGSSDAKPGSER